MTEPDAPTFEQALARLEAIVHLLEEGQIGLEDSLARYEEGVELMKRCYAILQQAEQRVALLTGVDGDGNPLTEPFDAGATQAPRVTRTNREPTAKAARPVGRTQEELAPEPDEETDTDAPRLF